MNRIHVGQTIGRGYRFLFHRFFAIAGLSWLPALALGVFATLWLPHFASDAALVSKGTLAAYWLGLDALALFAALAFFAATIAVPVTREALGLHDESVFAHFVVGRRELRLFLALLRFGVLLFAAAVLLTLLVGFAARLAIPVLVAKMGATSEATAAWRGIPLRSFVLGGSAFVLISVLAVLVLRLGFFLAPIAAIEERARVTRAWILSARNFWRVLIVTLALAVPLDLAARAVEYTLFGKQLQALLPQALAAHDPLLLVGWMAQHAVVLAAIGSTVLTLLIALFAGASAMAYRTLMPASDMQTVWQPTVRESVEEEAPMLPAMPAMAAPPLDVTLGDHQAHVAEPAVDVAEPAVSHEAETTVPHDTEMHASEAPAMAEELAPQQEPAPEVLPEAIAAEPAQADVAAASEAAATTQAAMADNDALPEHGEAQHSVLELAEEAPAHAEATPENVPSEHDVAAATYAANNPVGLAEPAQHVASAEPVTDLVENILPTGDPEVAPKEHALEAAE